MRQEAIHPERLPSANLIATQLIRIKAQPLHQTQGLDRASKASIDQFIDFRIAIQIKLSGKKLAALSQAFDVPRLENGGIRGLGPVPDCKPQIIARNRVAKARVAHNRLKIAFIRQKDIAEKSRQSRKAARDIGDVLERRTC